MTTKGNLVVTALDEGAARAVISANEVPDVAKIVSYEEALKVKFGDYGWIYQIIGANEILGTRLEFARALDKAGVSSHLVRVWA